MNKQIKSDEVELRELFRDFVEAGLHGRFADAFALVDEPYIGVGMWEQGIVKSKVQAEQVLRNGYRPNADTKIECQIKELNIIYMDGDAAVLIGEVTVIHTPKDGKAIQSDLVQTVGACHKSDGWRISFTHSSAMSLTAESVEAYPVRFLDETLSALKADLQAESGIQRDALTDVFNRDGFDNRVERLMRERSSKHNMALFMVDLDDFKQINDRLGHQIGDAVLQQVAGALRNTFRENDAVGRIGGDEFMVFLTGNFTAKFLEKKANELLNAMQLHLGDTQQIPVSASIGIAYGRSRVTFDKLYQIADMALYTAKRAGKCRYHLINLNGNVQYSNYDPGTNMLSLQKLLEYKNEKETSL